MIEVEQLTKSYGGRRAVDGLSFRALPGRVTGFLGPNGSGKSTTMRAVLGLVAPDSGRVLVAGRPFREHRAPLCTMGAVVDATGMHPKRSAAANLRALAATHGFGRDRVARMLAEVGLAEAADRRAGTFSLGMAQRLAIAAALLGDPAVLMLDEPVNGLDPAGVVWVRRLLRRLADEGRTVLVSSHLLDEMARTADVLVVVGRGRLLAEAPTAELVRGLTRSVITVRTPDAARLRDAVAGPGVATTLVDPTLLEIEGRTAAEVGEAARRHGLVVHELGRRTGSLEQAFEALTRSSVEFPAGAAS